MHKPLPPAKVQAYADTNGVPPGTLPEPRPARPHRVIINVDADTRDALRALAYASGMSVSSVAAEALRLLVPTIRPVMEAMGNLRTAPALAMEKLSAHAQDVADLAEATVNEIRSAAAGRPPSCNTGVNLPPERPE